MRKKKLYPILVLVILFSMSLLYVGCRPVHSGTEAEIAALERLAEKEEELLAEKEQERLAKAEEEKQTEVGQASPIEEDESLPAETITYTGDMSGLPIIFIVNFKTTEVTGSIACPIDGYPDYSIDDGKIDLNTLGITAKSTWIREMHNDEVVQTVEMIITGTINNDLSKIDGEIVNDLGESGVFTVYR